jgi:hypothetical protein|tara:strand:- start:4209 stop:5513 length:1305 start_codon:yes stop_codon:yes gene_type:complete
MVEFNPKGNNILDQELAVSGLEMNIEPATAIGLGLGALGVGASIFGGISSASAARSAANRQFQIAAADRKHQIKVAKATNKYNKLLDANDRANYEQEVDFAYKSLKKDWKFGRRIHRLNHLSSMKQFRKSKRLTKKQTRFNAQAEKFAIEQEEGVLRDTLLQQGLARESNLSSLQQAFFEGAISTKEQGIRIQGIKDRQRSGQFQIQSTINDLMTQGSVEKEAALVEGLVARGQAEIGQAGRSNAKSKQSAEAALHRGLRSLDNQLSGKYKQAGIQLAELNADASLQLSGAQLNLERINQAIAVAQEEYVFNNKVIDFNIESAIEASERNIRDIMLDRDVADLNIRANRMLRPKKLPYQPKPVMPPERIFLDRMEVIVPKPLKKDRKNKLERALERGDVVRVEKPEDGEDGSDQVSDYNEITTDPSFNVDDRFD